MRRALALPTTRRERARLVSASGPEFGCHDLIFLGSLVSAPGSTSRFKVCLSARSPGRFSLQGKMKMVAGRQHMSNAPADGHGQAF